LRFLGGRFTGVAVLSAGFATGRPAAVILCGAGGLTCFGGACCGGRCCCTCCCGGCC